MGEVIRLGSIEDVAVEAARRWLSIAGQAVEQRGRFTVALAGGSTPKLLYDLMASEPWREQAPWESTHVFFGDERRVPHSDPQSNYRMAREALLDKVPVSSNQVYPMDGTGLIKSAMNDYEAVMMRVFALERRQWPSFDLVLLGLGPDGHFASIFPGTRAVSDLSRMVLAYQVPQLHVERITLALPVFNNARNIIFMVAGAEKAAALFNTLHGDYQPSAYPAQALKPAQGGQIVWLVDRAAAAQLPGV